MCEIFSIFYFPSSISYLSITWLHFVPQYPFKFYCDRISLFPSSWLSHSNFLPPSVTHGLYSSICRPPSLVLITSHELQSYRQHHSSSTTFHHLGSFSLYFSNILSVFSLPFFSPTPPCHNSNDKQSESFFSSRFHTNLSSSLSFSISLPIRHHF